MLKRLFVAFVWLLLSGHTIAGELDDVTPQRGHRAAAITWTDDSGRVRHLSELAGYSVILLPLYTRCQTACLQNVARLKTALDDSAADPQQFRVLLFSFDSSDTPITLAGYRKHEHLPLGWSLGRASQENIDALLDSIGFQAGKAGREFAHPNMLIVLDSKLRVAKWIYGNNYSARDIESALQVAAGRSDWVGEHSALLYALLLFAASLVCVALVQQITSAGKEKLSPGLTTTNT